MGVRILAQSRKSRSGAALYTINLTSPGLESSSALETPSPELDNRPLQIWTCEISGAQSRLGTEVHDWPRLPKFFRNHGYFRSSSRSGTARLSECSDTRVFICGQVERGFEASRFIWCKRVLVLHAFCNDVSILDSLQTLFQEPLHNHLWIILAKWKSPKLQVMQQFEVESFLEHFVWTWSTWQSDRRSISIQ